MIRHHYILVYILLFQKSNLARDYNYNSGNVFMEKLHLEKKKKLELMKSYIRHRLNNISKSKNVSQEITFHEKYSPSTDNINDFKFNDAQVNHYLAKYYQKKDNVNLILSNKNKFMKSFFLEKST